MKPFPETYNPGPGDIFRKAFWAASEQTNALTRGKHSESVEIVRQISKPDLCPGPDAANSSQYEVSGPLHLTSKDVFDARSGLCPGSIAALLPFRQLTIPAALALDVFSPAFFRKVIQLLFRPVGRVSPYITTGIGFIEQLLKYIAVMDSGISYRVPANQLMFHIHNNMRVP